MFKKFKKLKLNRIMPILMMAIVLFFATSISVSALELLKEYDEETEGLAYGDEYNKVYGASAEMDVEKDHTLVGDMWHGAVNMLEHLISPFIYTIAEFLNWIIKNGQFDLTLDAIVYGRVASTKQMTIDMSHFGLEQNNPYGVIGASLYVLLKRASYAIIPVVIMVLLLINLFRNNRKGREQLKDLGTNTVFYFITIELMPYIVELYIYVRDFFMFFVKKGLARTSEGGLGALNVTDTLWDMMEDHYENTMSIIIALMMVAIAFAGFFYLWDYVKIALLLAVTFGLFPIIVLLMYFKPKIVSDWFDLLTPNLLIPFIDSILLLAPTIILAIAEGALGIENMAGLNGKSVGIYICIVLLCCIFSIKGIRNIILKKLFHYEGGSREGGMGMLVLMAAKSMVKSSTSSAASAGHGGGGSGGTATSGESTAKAEEASESGKVMEDADKLIDDDSTGTNSGSNTGSGTENADAELEEQNVSAMDAEEIQEDITDEVMEEAGELSEETEGMPGEVLEENPQREALGEPADMGTAEDNANAGVLQQGETMVEDTPDITDKPQPTINLPEHVSGIENSSDDSGAGSYGVVEEGGGATVANRVSSEAPSSPSGTDSGSDGVHTRMRESAEYANLSERDQKRFENLARMDDAEAQIASNNKIIEDAGYDKGTIRQQYKQESVNHAELLAKENELKNSRDMITDKSSGEYQKADAVYNEAKANRERSEGRLGDMQRSYNAAQQNVEHIRNLEHYRQVERQYAQNSGLGGMSTRTYNNASDFFNQKRVEQIQKRHADYRNFDSGKFDGILSPQERENFYRERAAHQKRDEIAQRTKTVGKAVGGTLGAAAGTFGGAGAMAAGAAIGAGIVGGATGKVAHGASGIGHNEASVNRQQDKVAKRNANIEAEQARSQAEAQGERQVKKQAEQLPQYTGVGEADAKTREANNIEQDGRKLTREKRNN